MKFIVRVISLIALGTGLAGCFGSATPPPEDHYYRLPPLATAQGRSGARFETIAVEALQTDGVHHERAILYVDSQSPLELRRYHYHMWILPPSRLVQEHLISYLRERGTAQTVLRARPGVQSPIRISGYLKRFERVIDNGAIRVDVELELHLLRDGKPVVIREFRRSPQVDDDSMAATVKAMGEALDAIFTAFAADLPE